MSTDTSFRDLVARLNAMNNVTPEQERASLMEGGLYFISRANAISVSTHFQKKIPLVKKMPK